MGLQSRGKASGLAAVRHGLDATGGLWIEWDDGHQTSLDAARLRSLCPCAQCREAGEARIRGRLAEGRDPGDGDAPEPASWPPGSTQLVSVAPVGRYGLSPTWGDGHGTGIYTWEMLRGWCDCYACRTTRSGS